MGRRPLTIKSGHGLSKVGVTIALMLVQKTDTLSSHRRYTLGKDRKCINLYNISDFISKAKSSG